METSTMIFVGVGLFVVIGGLYFYFYQKENKNQGSKSTGNKADTGSARQLQLQAYERLVILAERIALPNVISRINEPGLSKRDMQQLLTATIRQEYDYNLSQQIYVTNEAWDAVRNLKEQNIHIVNQLASILPEDLSGNEFNKKVIEFIMSQPQGSMHSMVQEALSYEARKLMA
jgi:hypothetical protein